MPRKEFVIGNIPTARDTIIKNDADIGRLAKDLNVHKDSLLVINHDPYAITDSQYEQAAWFKDLWKLFGYKKGVHLRRMHYQIVSTEGAIHRNDTLYQNDQDSWERLGTASKFARYLWYTLETDEDRDHYAIDPEWMEDHRNGDPVGEIVSYKKPSADIWVSGGFSSSFEVNACDEIQLPSYHSQINSPQQYHLEIWCEKSTQDDILKPLIKKYGMVLRRGMGELSITIALECLRRFSEASKPVRIFYLSDFDPSGWNMPESMSRKIQFFNQMCKELNLRDVKIFHTLLTHEQCEMYHLPETMMKSGEKRADEWEKRWGRKATELDALEAVKPGVLAAILRKEIERYYDPTLEDRLRAAHAACIEEEVRIEAEVHEKYQDDIAALEDARSDAFSRISDIIREYEDARDACFQPIIQELEARKPTIENIPTARDATEKESLYDASRSYLDQNAYFQEHSDKIIEYCKPRGRKPKGIPA